MDTQQSRGSNVRSTPQYSNGEGVAPGWRTFSGVMISIAGIWNILDGMIAIFDANYYESVAEGRNINLPITDSIEAWGWFALITGCLMLGVAYGIFNDATWAQIVGVFVVGFNMIFHLGFLAAFPLWSLVVIGIDVLIIYGIVMPARPNYQSRL